MSLFVFRCPIMSVSSVSFLASVELTRDFCEQLDSLVGPQLTLLASDICEQFTINRRISGSVDSLISNISKFATNNLITATTHAYIHYEILSPSSSSKGEIYGNKAQLFTV